MSVLGLFQGASVEPGTPGGLTVLRQFINTVHPTQQIFYRHEGLYAHLFIQLESWSSTLFSWSFISEAHYETRTTIRLVLQCGVL